MPIAGVVATYGREVLETDCDLPINSGYPLHDLPEQVNCELSSWNDYFGHPGVFLRTRHCQCDDRHDSSAISQTQRNQVDNRCSSYSYSSIVRNFTPTALHSHAATDLQSTVR